MLKTFLAILPLIWPAGPAFAQGLPANAAVPALPAKSVLILHSGYDSDPWVQTWRQGFRRIVSADSGGVEIWAEYLGYPRVRWARYLDQLASHYSEKYRGHRFDLVITHGDRALEFVQAHRDLQFLDAPIVFSGVDPSLVASYANQPGFFGVAAPMDFRRTLDLALGLHPDAREIVFISPGFENRPQIEPLIVDYRPELPMSVWHDDYLSDIEARLTTLGARAVVVPLGVPLDSLDKPVDVRTFARRLSSVGEAPVYTVWDVLLGYGVVGGRMVDTRAHGEEVASLALEVLAGASRVVSADAVTPARDTLDFEQLEHYGIDVSLLPEDSVVVNQPRRLLEVSRPAIFVAIGVIALLLGVVFVLMRDITDRKLAEDELRESRKRLQLIADNVPGLLVRIDVDRRVRFINREAEQWFGFQAEGAVGKHIKEIIGDQAYETAQPYIDRALDGETTSFEMERPHEYGPLRWASGTLAPDFDEQGEVHGYYALLTDITERKRAQDQVKRAQVRLLEQQRCEQDSVRYELNRVRDELVRQTRLAAIGQVAASIAHDLRNPLGAIRNAKFYLSRRLPNDQPKWQEYLDIMEREIVVADTIINNLLDMGRAKRPDKSELDLEKALRDSFRRLKGTSNVEFNCVFDHRPFSVYADPSQLGRVLDNLIVNATQAMGERGRITVDAKSETNFDTIRVKDEGPGVPSEIRSRIFEPLVSGKAKGTGLGLSICRQIVESHGGRIDLLRSGDTGAEFEIRLPRRMAASMEVKQA